MTRALARYRLFVPLVHLAALLLLIEEWCWNAGMRLARACARWPLLAALERRVRALPPYAALVAFVLPGLLLLPVKLLALMAIAHGHPASGIATIVVAKLGGAAVVARLYALTLPTLLAVGWFARCHCWFMGVKTRCVGHLRASHLYCRTGHALRALKLGLRRLWRLGRRGRPASHGARVLRRFIVQWRARRR
jgi:hypothetical protein